MLSKPVSTNVSAPPTSTAPVPARNARPKTVAKAISALQADARKPSLLRELRPWRMANRPRFIQTWSLRGTAAARDSFSSRISYSDAQATHAADAQLIPAPLVRTTSSGNLSSSMNMLPF
jgi:hypothetical protein